MNEKVFDDLLIKLEYILEADPRTFSNPICDYDYLFDAFGDLYRIIKKIDHMLAQHNGSAIDLIDKRQFF